MGREAALREAGVKSAPQIKRLGLLLTKKQESGRNANGLAKATKTKPTKKRSVAKTSQLRTRSRDEARSSLPAASNVPPLHEAERPEAASGQTLITFWTEQNVRWWISMMRMTPTGFFLSSPPPDSEQD
jgi:hypothetical protein